MLSLNGNQTALVAAADKRVKWLFTVVTPAPVTYRWSTTTCTYGGNTYSFKVLPKSFGGIRLQASKADSGIQAPNDVKFKITNPNDALTGSDFKNGTVQIDLVLDNGVIGDTVIATWKFNIKKCDPGQQELVFTCEDFMQEHLDGSWPNKPLIKDLFLTDDTGMRAEVGNLDDLCVPIPFGTPFEPLASIYDTGTTTRYFLLGEAAYTYDITKCRMPRELGYKSDWTHGVNGISMDQASVTGSDGVSYRMFQAQIVDTDDDGVADAYGGHVWSGNRIINMPTVFSRNDTVDINGNSTGAHDGGNGQASLTDSAATWGVDDLIGAYVVNETQDSYGLITDNTGTNVTAAMSVGDWDNGDVYTIGGPASIVRWILLDMGIAATDIDDASFGAAELVFAKTWGGLIWNGCFTVRTPRKKILAFLMNQCNSRLVIRDKIYWKVLSKTSQQTITDADVQAQRRKGPTTFKYQGVTEKKEDSGYIEWQPADEIQDAWQLLIVSAKFSSGAHTGANDVADLEDTNQNWPTNSLIGGKVENITDVSEGTITANTNDDVVAALAGGTEDLWDTGDTYRIVVTQHISNDKLPVHFIQDNLNAQRAGVLYYERKFLGKSKGIFKGKGTILALEADDILTINEASYGGTYDALIESMKIALDLSIELRFKTFDL